MKITSMIVLLLLCLNRTETCANDAVPEQYSEAVSEISDWLSDQISDKKYVGVSIGFIKGDYMWTQGFGLADIERQVPMTSESVHRMASISKSMTAVGVVRLAQEGKIDLDAEVQTYVPAFPRKEWPVTVRQLLGHLSGISHYRNFTEESNHTNRFTTPEALALFQDRDLRFKPGTRYSYTTYGYSLLGAVIEGATGQSYREYMTEHVWIPLGMTSTRTDDLRDIITNRVAGYTDVNGEFINCRPVTTSMKYAGGGTLSTVGDMLRFARGLMDGEILEAQWTDRMWTPMTLESEHLTSYGMGWRIGSDSRYYEVYHGGRQDGTRTFLWLIPSQKLAIAVLCNYDNADRWTPARMLLERIIMRPFILPHVHASQPGDAVRITFLGKAVNVGCAYYDRFKNALTSDTDRIASGFKYLNESLALTDESAIEESMDEGLWPITNQTLLCATSFMADALTEQHGKDYLWKYHRAGIIQICSDYIDMYRSDMEISQMFRFSIANEKLVKSALRDWLAIWTPEIENLNLEHAEITAETERILRKVLRGKQFGPDLGSPLIERAREELYADQLSDALRIAGIAVDLYPTSSRFATELGIIKLATGDYDAGSKLIGAAHRNPPGSVNHQYLNTTAYVFAGRGRPGIGADILRAAIELFPNEANLYDSRAEMHLMMGDTSTAITLYKKALQIDPDIKSSSDMLKKINFAD